MNNVTMMISEQLNLRVKEMNQVSYGVLANTHVRYPLLFLNGYNYDNVNKYIYLDAHNRITDNLFALSLPFPDIDRINVFSDQNMFFSSKQFNNDSEVIKERLLARVKPTDMEINNNADFILIGPHLDEWAEDNRSIVFSLQRMIKGSQGVIGLIEVQSKYEIINELCNISDITSGRIYIIDREDNIIYPFSETARDRIDFYLEWCKNNDYKKKDNDLVARVYDDFTKTTQVVASKYSDYTDWTVIYALPQAFITKPIYRILWFIIVIGMLGAILSFFIAYKIASYIYTPLRKLKHKVESFDYQSFSFTRADDINYDFNNADEEIAVLNNTFDKMALKLKKSVEETIKTRFEVQKSYYKVLQSQINPHFLYNTISIISIMGRNLGDRKIPDICKKLTYLLKYSSDINEDYATVLEEKNNLSSYLGLLKYRFEHRLEYIIRIDPRLDNYLLPRMTLQPFVENSFKHGLYGMKGPITIQIEGRMLDQEWEIVIQDNGSGISEDALADINESINLFNNLDSGPDVNQQIKTTGLGVLNTFIRLKILLGDRLTFKIGNRANGGTEVVIRVKSE
jgi:two-component system sensor histidine kinase YesM